MAKKDPRIDAYIERARPFARPILKRLRRLTHRAAPKVVETIKWGHPHFMLDGMFAGMAAFTRHCGYYFWRGRAFAKHDARFTKAEGGGMGNLGRLTTVDQMPTDVGFVSLVRTAAKLSAARAGAKKAKRKPKPPPRVPAALKAALARDATARKHFAAMPPSARRDYCEWIAEAKQDATRAKRLATALAQLRAGKRRHWKHEAR